MADSAKLHQLASVISRQAQVRNICIVSGTMRQRLEAVGDSLRISYGLKVSGRFVEFMDDDGPAKGVQALIMLRAHGLPPEEDQNSDDHHIYIEASFRLDYSLTSMDGLDDSHLEAFSRLNGLFNAWPYWREFVHTSTSRMGLPSLLVPLLTSGMLAGIYEDDNEESVTTTPEP